MNVHSLLEVNNMIEAVRKWRDVHYRLRYPYRIGVVQAFARPRDSNNTLDAKQDLWV